MNSITTLPLRHLIPALSEDEVLRLYNRPEPSGARGLLTGADVDHIVTECEAGFRPDGSLVYAYVPRVIPFTTCLASFIPARRIASRDVAGGLRASAAGSHMAPRIRKDGTEGNRWEVAPQPHIKGSREGAAGYDANRNMPGCRAVGIAATNPELFAELNPMSQLLDELLRVYLPEHHAAQREQVQKIDPRYVIPGTVFNQLVSNLCWQTAVHKHKENLGTTVMTLLTAGRFSGGELCFPRYRLGIRVQMQDVVFFDGHEYHANLPLVGTPGAFDRLSLVYYARKAMLKKCPCVDTI